MIKTNISHLDDYLEGGIKRNSLTLLSAKPGVENSPFAYHIMREALISGNSCIYVSNSKGSKVVEDEIKAFGWDTKEHKASGKLIFVDAYSGLVEDSPTERFFPENARNIQSLTKTLNHALNASGDEHVLVVYDSLSTLIDNCGPSSIDALPEWKKLFKDKNATGVFLFTEWPYEEQVLSRLGDIADAVIQLKAVERKVVSHKYLTVSKASWIKKKDKCIKLPFEVKSCGGLMSLNHY